MKIEGVIFDLDDTLFDCTGQLTGPARHRAAEIFAATNPSLNIETLCEMQATLSQTISSSESLHQIGRQFDLPDAIVEQALRAYNMPAVEAIAPFVDAHRVLAILQGGNYHLSIVTSGNPDRQRQKVAQLSLSTYFSEADGTLCLHDDRQSTDKSPFLIQAAQKMAIAHPAILSVGDKLTAEISAANRLGMHTARLRHGRQKNRAPQTPREHPDFDIQTLSDLLDILP